VPLLKLRKLDVSLTADDLSRLVETVETMQDAAELSRNAATAIKLLAMTDTAPGARRRRPGEACEILCASRR